LRTALGANDGKYEFSELDIELHVGERVVSLPDLKSETTDDPELLKIIINGKAIFWPANLPCQDLPWLYHEIFDDFAGNPSSYNFPPLDYPNRKWVIDAGAAEGYFSIFALQRSPQAQVISVEPLSLMRKALERTLSLYDNNNVSVVSAALADRCGWADMQLDPEHISDSKLTANDAESDLRNSKEITEKVKIITLDQLAEDQALGMGGLIKMDIEGFEMAALSGSVHLLKRHKPALAIAVYHELDNAHKCADIIRQANPNYDINFRGCYGYFEPPRPYMLFAN
jgi:FkbM family methyltransferase